MVIKGVIKSQRQGSTKHRVFYSIIAYTKDKHKITIADTLEPSRVTDFVEKKIQKALRLSDGRSDLLDSWSG